MKNNQKEIVNILKAMIGGALLAVALKIFVNQAEIIPAGFTGITVLLQRVFLKFFNITLPFTPVNLLLNLPGAFVALKMIGKKYTITSFLVLVEISILTDLMPSITLTEDVIILSVFGGIINAFGASLIFSAGTSTGGTDFISMSISNKYHISVFQYVMIFNIVLIIIQGLIFGFSKSFYSIIYQYVNTEVLNMRYKHYEKKTLLIISEKTKELEEAIFKQSKHSITRISGIGCYSGKEKNILYTITTTPELRNTVNLIKSIDDKAFVNIINSSEIQGNFNYLPVDLPDNKVEL